MNQPGAFDRSQERLLARKQQDLLGARLADAREGS
jgi:hypothetical protein